MLPKQFKPNYLYDLIRLGKNNDGGYLVGKNSVLNSSTLISFGINDDCSFEKEFKNLNNLDVFCFDYDVDASFWFKKFRRALRKALKGEIKILKDFFINIYNYKIFFNRSGSFFYKQKIVGKEDNHLLFDEANINKIIKTNNLNKNIFLKIDIEGSEYEILQDIISFSSYINGLVIEFHDVDLNLNKIINFINSIDLNLIHIHPNNSTNCRNGIPSCLEFSFEKNPIIVGDNVNFPHNLDQKNDRRNNDLKLIFSIN
jgi:hypothetical protein